MLAELGLGGRREQRLGQLVSLAQAGRIETDSVYRSMAGRGAEQARASAAGGADKRTAIPVAYSPTFNINGVQDARALAREIERGVEAYITKLQSRQRRALHD